MIFLSFVFLMAARAQDPAWVIAERHADELRLEKQKQEAEKKRPPAPIHGRLPGELHSDYDSVRAVSRLPLTH